jgi:hypothetical protein
MAPRIRPTGPDAVPNHPDPGKAPGGVGTEGKVGVQLSADLSQFDELAITIEPGEQQLPTTPILIGHPRSGTT